MSVFSSLLGTMKTDFLIGGPKGIMLRKVTGGFEVRNFDGSALEDLTADNIIANTSVKSDSIVEKTLDSGVTVEGVLIKDGLVDGKDVSTLATDSEVIKKDGTVAFTGDQSLGNHKLTNLADPTQDQDAATKAYVDAVAQGLQVHASVRLATADGVALPACTPSGAGAGKTLTGNANGALSVDGIAVAVSDRILVKDQANAVDNGIYVVTATGDGSNPFVLTRATDFDGSPAAEVTAGDFFFVEEGNTEAGEGYVLISPNPITVDTTELLFAQFSGAGQITAGDGLSKVGNTLSVNVDNSTIEISSDALRVKDSGITAGKIGANAVTAVKLNSDVAGAAIALNGTTNAIDVQVDDSTIEVSGNSLRIKGLTASNITDLTDGGDSSLHYHSADRDRANHTGTQTASTISDFQSAVRGEISVSDTNSVDLTYSSGQISADVKVDNATIEIDATNGVQVKDSGITAGKIGANAVTAAKLNSDVAGAAIVLNGTTNAIDVNVDGTTIEIATDALRVKANVFDAYGAAATAESNANNYTDTAVSTLAVDSTVVHLAGVETITGDKSFSGAFKVDTISELTSGAGVTIDGVLLKDSKVSGSYVDVANLTALTTADDSDELLINDVSASTNKKITKANLLSGIATASGLSKHIEITVGTSSTSSTTAIPTGARIKSVTTVINTEYSAGATLQVIVDGATDLEIQAASDNEPTVANVYESRPFSVVGASNTGVASVVVGGSPVAGSASVIIEFIPAALA